MSLKLMKIWKLFVCCQTITFIKNDTYELFNGGIDNDLKNVCGNLIALQDNEQEQEG